LKSRIMRTKIAAVTWMILEMMVMMLGAEVKRRRRREVALSTWKKMRRKWQKNIDYAIL